jgi:16S rRNA (guanine527-N7)-methyltransferase
MQQAIERGLAALGLEASPDAAARLAQYLDLIQRWNRVYNLTAITDPAEMVSKHLLDSLACLPHLEAARLGDIGSGAGLPGIPIAILRPALPVALVESSGKKARFLRTASRELGLENVTVAETRIERWRPEPAPDAAVARALAPLPELCALVQPWLPRGGRLYALKGPRAEQELGALPAGFELERSHRLEVPGLDAERWLHVLRRTQV